MHENVDNLINFLNDTIVFNQPIEIPLEYTLVVKPDPVMAKKISSFITLASEQDPGHIFYSPENLHATIYAPINIENSVDNLRSFLAEELSGKELIFDVRGLSSSVIGVRPVNFSLFDLRHKMMNFLGDSARAKRNRTIELMSWMNFVRFRDKPSDQYYDFIAKNREKSFGQFKPSSLELYKNRSKILNNSTEKIFSIDLAK